MTMENGTIDLMRETEFWIHETGQGAVAICSSCALAVSKERANNLDIQDLRCFSCSRPIPCEIERNAEIQINEGE